MIANELELVKIATGNMRVIWDAPIEMDDSIILRADVFLPEKEGKYPVIIALGPYAKGPRCQTSAGALHTPADFSPW
jgi:hypothetical protein